MLHTYKKQYQLLNHRDPPHRIRRLGGGSAKTAVGKHKMDEIRFNDTYYFASLVESYIYGKSGFWRYSEEVFKERSLRFNKETLLHHFIETTIWNYYNRQFIKHGGVYEDNEDFLEFLRNLFDSYNVSIEFFDDLVNIDESEDLHEDFKKWWIAKEPEFRQLFSKIADDVFYIFFGNRELLLHFNELVSQAVMDTVYKDSDLSSSGKIKRRNIPQWVKKAVFARDKGRCTKCSKDLTGLIALDSKQHYDHIVPLNQYGANDPTNIQLLCKSCNLKKSGNIIETSKLYLKWWK